MRPQHRMTTIAATATVALLVLTSAPASAAPPDSPLPATPSETHPSGLTARIESVDVTDRTAVVSGNAEAGATVVVDDTFEVDANDAGVWRAELGHLPLGPASTHLAEYRGETLVDTLDLEFFVGTPLDVTRTFPEARTERVHVEGRATPESLVEVLSVGGGLLGSGRTDRDGAVDVEVLAPDAGGVHTVTVRQSLDGEKIDETRLDLDYGAAVSVASPADGTIHTGGPVALTGKGVPRGEVRVREKGSTSWLAPATTVLASGTWRVTTAPLDDSGHDLEVVQIGRGHNRTTAALTLEGPETPEPAPLLPGTITGPATYTAGTLTRIEGMATPRATVALVNAWGTEVARGIPVDGAGHWHHDRVLAAPSVYTLWVAQTLATQTAKDGPFTIHPETLRPEFRVISPNREAGYVSGTATTFSGTADPRAAVHVQNKWGTRVTGPVDATPDGGWSLSYVLAAPSVYDLTFVETTPGTSPRTVAFGEFRPRS